MPTSASVVGSTCIVTTSPIAFTQWRAVPMYSLPPPAKMKFAVQPAGATMQPPAETPAPCTPGQSVFSRSSPTETPFAPAAWIFCSSELVSHAGRGRPVAADPVAGISSRATQAAANAAPARERMGPPESKKMRAARRGPPHMDSPTRAGCNSADRQRLRLAAALRPGVRAPLQTV